MDAPWGNPNTTISLPTRQHPYLFVNRAEIESARKRAAKTRWAGRDLKKLLGQADASLSAPLSIPTQPGAWAHYYVCKICGVGLETSGTRHICPRCGREYTGWPYDAVVAGMKHEDNFASAETNALAYAFTGQQKYADRARQILTGYAQRYDSFPLHDYKNGHMQRGARITAQTLNEAIILVKAAWAYDLIYDSDGMTSAVRQTIESKLIRPMAAVVRRNDWGVSNWQSWHNAAMAAAGFVLQDKGMVDHAINGKSGFVFQMNHSVLPDGFWYEGTASYHFYALDAIQWEAMAMRQAGIQEFAMPQLKSMYRAPLDYVFPNGKFPPVNDSDPLSLDDTSSYYEMAYTWYHNADFGAAAALGKRRSLNALLWGADHLPPPQIKTGSSQNFAGLGAVMLRNGTGPQQSVVHLDYGPHGGAHGHFDKLATIFFALGKDLAVDPSRLEYGAPLHHEWYMTSIAHNTMTVDGINQRPTSGKLISFQNEKAFSAATAECDTAYKDVALTRTTVLTPDWYLDIFRGDSVKSHQFDLTWHIRGTQTTSSPTSQWNGTLGSKDGYQHIANIRQVSNPAGQACTIIDYRQGKDGGILRQWLVPAVINGQASTAQLFLADGVTDREVTTCAMTLQRAKARAVEYVTVLEPIVAGHEGSIRSISEGPLHLDGSREIHVLTDKSDRIVRITSQSRVSME